MGKIEVVDSKEELKSCLEGVDRKDIFFVDRCYIFRFPFRYFSLKALLGFRNKVYRDRYMHLYTTLGFDESKRFDRPVRYVGNWKWAYAAIIGICESKKVIVYPLIHGREMDYRTVRLNRLIGYLKGTETKLVVRVTPGTDISGLHISE